MISGLAFAGKYKTKNKRMKTRLTNRALSEKVLLKKAPQIRNNKESDVYQAISKVSKRAEREKKRLEE